MDSDQHGSLKKKYSQMSPVVTIAQYQSQMSLT